MGGITIGPLAFSAERAPVIAGMLVLLLAAGLLSRRTAPGLSSWATAAIITAAIAARAGFVLAHATEFRSQPLAVLAIWQGGFAPNWGLAGFVLASLWILARRWRLILPAAASLVLAATAWNAVHQLAQGEDINLPDRIMLADLRGRPVAPADWQGQPVVINLWATWCPPCRREMPMMAEIAATLSDIDLHFVNQGEGAGVIREYLMRENIAIAPLTDHASQMMQHFRAVGLPATLFIDATGQLRAAHLGEISRPALLAAIEDLKRNP